MLNVIQKEKLPNKPTITRTNFNNSISPMKTNNTKRVKESVMAVIDESPVRNKHKLN